MKENIYKKAKKYIRAAMLMILLIIPLNSFAPEMDKKTTEDRSEYFMDDQLISKNMMLLKDSTKKTREEVFNLAQPVIEILLKRGNYNNCFPNMDSLSYAITCIFVSESSNYRGESARSMLWLEHNNPFGITSSKGKTLKSWEMIDGKRVVMNRTFCTYNSFSDAIDSLMSDCLLKNSYTLTANSNSVKNFLHNLYKNNYMTNEHWPEFAYNKIYLVSIKKNKDIV